MSEPAAASRRSDLAANLAAVQERVGAACAAAGRDRAEVTVVAVTKTWPEPDLIALRELGCLDLGENRDQEAARKAAVVTGVRWHFVGAVQSNKAASIASYADVVHAVDRLRVVTALAAGAVRADRVVRVLLQVSLDGDPDRGGADPAEVPGLADVVAGAEGLALSGVMAVAPRGADPDTAFGRLAQVAAALRERHPQAGWVSAGMSGDLEAAVRHGATHLRVGTALLGVRPPPRR